MIAAHFFSFLLAGMLSVAGAAGASAQTTPVGLWDTISDVDGKPNGVIEIREVDGRLIGTVRALFNEPDTSTCDACRDDRKGRRIVGMEILRGMRPDGAEWSGGQILDPENGKTYKARMHLEDSGKKLVVRGYIGLSIFGRTQTWVRHLGPIH